VEYSREIQARAAEELARLPDESALVEMMGDHAVMREQAKACKMRQPFSQAKAGLHIVWLFVWTSIQVGTSRKARFLSPRGRFSAS
jgi:hypothetical protein